MIREKDIKHENGNFWVADYDNSYIVFRAGITHSVSDSAYSRDADGLSIAIARCDYLAKRYPELRDQPFPKGLKNEKNSNDCKTRNETK